MTNDDDVIKAAMARGARIKARLLKRAGGLLSAREAAELVGIKEATLRRRQLIFLKSGARAGYPAFQFESATMIKAVEAVLKVLDPQEPWMHLTFFFLRMQELGGKTPIAAIREGLLDAVIRAASHYGEHGAS